MEVSGNDWNFQLFGCSSRKYLTGRKLLYDTNSGAKKYIVADVVLQPLLRNIIYNSVLVAFAKDYTDNITVIVVAKHLANFELHSSEAIAVINACLKM